MTNARLVILFLGAALLLTTAGLVWLAHDGINAPDVLIAIPSSALGALSAFLVKSSGEDSPVNVEQAQNVNAAAETGAKRGARGAVDVVTVLVVAVLVVLLLVLARAL